MSYASEAAIRRKFGEFRTRTGKRGREYVVNCPFCVKRGHSPDTERKMNMNPGRDMYYCHRCGASGILSRLIGVLPEFTGPAPRDQVKNLPVRAPGYMVPLNALEPGTGARGYLERRGFDADVLAHYFGVACCTSGFRISNNDKLWFDASGTIVFPAWMDGKIVGWQCRTPYEPKELSDGECEALGMPLNSSGVRLRPPKYMTPSAMDKSRTLFNYDNARKGDVVVLCEGPLDAIAVGMCGVAAFGKNVSDEQMRLIKSYWKMAILLLDPDADSTSATMELQLRLAMPTMRVTLQGADDAGDMAFTDLWAQIFAKAAQEGIDLNKHLPPHWHHARARSTTKWTTT